MIAAASSPRTRTSGITAPCRHCGQLRCLNSRRLCWPCRRQPAVVSLYPSRAAPCGVPDFYGRFRSPASPTAARPGTAEKVEEMGRRAERGEGLFHEADGAKDDEVMR